MQSYFDTIIKKIPTKCRCFVDENSDKIDNPLPSFLKIFKVESMLDEDDLITSKNKHEVICESIRSTDENYMGTVNDIPCFYMNQSDQVNYIKREVVKSRQAVKFNETPKYQNN